MKYSQLNPDSSSQRCLDGGDRFRSTTDQQDFFRIELARADVVVRGLRPHEHASSLRAEYDRWRAVRADLVYVALTPFGVCGPLADWTGGEPAPGPDPEPEQAVVTITIEAPPNVKIVVQQEVDDEVAV